MAGPENKTLFKLNNNQFYTDASQIKAGDTVEHVIQYRGPTLSSTTTPSTNEDSPANKPANQCQSTSYFCWGSRQHFYVEMPKILKKLDGREIVNVFAGKHQGPFAMEIVVIYKKRTPNEARLPDHIQW